MDTPTGNLLSQILSVLQTIAPKPLTQNPIDTNYTVSHDFSRDFLGGLTAVGAGTGNSTQAGTYGMNNVENAIGVTECDTGTTATGRRTLGTQGLQSITTGLADIQVGLRLALNQLSSSTDAFTSTVGFINNSGAGDHFAGAYFSYTHSANGGRWQANTASGTASPARTSVDTGVVADNSYHVFEVYIPINASAAYFYIDAVQVAKIVTNIPPTSSAANVAFGYGFKIEKSIGTTVASQSCDWYYYQQQRIYPR